MPTTKVVPVSKPGSKPADRLVDLINDPHSSISSQKADPIECFFTDQRYYKCSDGSRSRSRTSCDRDNANCHEEDCLYHYGDDTIQT